MKTLTCQRIPSIAGDVIVATYEDLAVRVVCDTPQGRGELNQCASRWEAKIAFGEVPVPIVTALEKGQAAPALVHPSLAGTGFTQAVRRVVGDLAQGATMSYGEVAIAAGSPGAARAVGNVMARNPTPILIPCHRVVGGGGQMGGFSMGNGVALKREMLSREGVARR